MISTDVIKTLILSAEVPETPAITSNISVDISTKQTVKSYSEIVRNDEYFNKSKRNHVWCMGNQPKSTLRAAREVQFDACNLCSRFSLQRRIF